jgi:hypothetical protein
VGRPRILVTNWVHGEVLAWLAAFGDVDANTTPAPWPACEVRARAADADAVLAFMPDRIDAAFLAAVPGSTSSPARSRASTISTSRLAPRPAFG